MINLKSEFVVDQFLKGQTRSQILHQGKEMKLNRMFIKRTLCRFQDTQSTEDRTSPGRPEFCRTPVAIKTIGDKIRRNPRQSMCMVSKEQGMSRRTIRRLVTGDLRVRPYKRGSCSAQQRRPNGWHGLDSCWGRFVRHTEKHRLR